MNLEQTYHFRAGQPMVLDRPDHRHRDWDVFLSLDPPGHGLAGLSAMEKSHDVVSPKEKKYASTALLKPLRAFYARRKIRIPKTFRCMSWRMVAGLFSDWKRAAHTRISKANDLFPDREAISIPVGRRWRLLAEWQDGKVIPIRLLSHEAYNHKWKWEKAMTFLTLSSSAFFLSLRSGLGFVCGMI